MKFVRVLILLWGLAVAANATELEKIEIGFISVEQTPMEDFFRMLSEKYDRNFVIEEPSIRKLTVNVRLRKVSLRTLLDAVCRMHGLAYTDHGTHIGITAVRSYYEKANFIKNDHNFVSKRLQFTPVNAVIELLSNLMPGKVVVNAAKEYKLYQNLYDATPDLAIPAAAAQAEAEILPGESGSQSSGQGRSGGQTERLNPNYLYLTAFGKTNTIYLSSADADLLQKALKLIETLDEPVREVLIQGRILEVTLNDEFKSFFDFVTRDKSLEASSEMASSVVSVGNVQYTFLDSLTSANIEILKTEGNAKTLASPMLMAADRTMATMELNQDYSVLKGWEAAQVVTNETSTVVVPPAPIYETESLGTSLKIVPYINDNGEVLLNLNINISTLLPNSQEILVLSGESSYEVQTFDAINKNEITATLITNDRQGIILGGIFRDEEVDEEQKVPFLGDIPLLGIPFKKTKTSNTRRELVIILTPYIIDPGKRSAALLEELREKGGVSEPIRKNEYERLEMERGIKEKQ
jgi:type II secretory pathway component GspD/PulD (secretin)